MDWRKWFRPLPLFGMPPCCYCGAPADSRDHTPPRCLLPRKLPNTVQAMTIPACGACNGGFSVDEIRLAAVVSTVSFLPADREAVAPGGRIHSALQSDRALNQFIRCRLDSDGFFHPDRQVKRTISRIMAKTAAGLLFYEFRRLVPTNSIDIIAIEHTTRMHPLSLIKSHQTGNRGGWAEVTSSGRKLERQVLDIFGQTPTNMPEWRRYVPDFFEYMFVPSSRHKLLTAMKLHNALTVIAECPWPKKGRRAIQRLFGRE